MAISSTTDFEACHGHIEWIRSNKFSIGKNDPHPLTQDLHYAVTRLSAQLYTKDVHFLMEIIRNAEDNEYEEGVEPTLEFVLTTKDITGTGAPATLLVFNNEVGFSRKDMESICSVGRSTKKGKRKLGYIGEKGIGFKSVFLVSSRPHIFSNGYRVKFGEEPNPDCGIGYIVPEWVGISEKPTPSDLHDVYGRDRNLPTTTIVLPLKPEKVEAVNAQLSKLHPELLLLLLSKLKRLHVTKYGFDPEQDDHVSVVSISNETNHVELNHDECADVDWDNLGFNVMPTDYMYIMKCAKEGNFEQGQLSPYGNIELSPYAGVLNYGQGLFEGTKAYGKEDGRILLFRPDQNAIRMKIGAERMCMPSPSVDQFVDAVKQTVVANKRWVPPPGKGSLYVRPLLMGSGPVLGVAPAPEYTFLVYASPVCNYFKDGFAPLNLYVEDEFDRASPGGTGGVKAISNYAPVLTAQIRAKNKGFSDVIYLDSVNKRYVEEVSSCNIFTVKGNLIATPATNGTILSGVTRRSIIEIAGDHGYQVEERGVTVDELMDADEVFCTGTAVGVASVGSITYHNTRVEFRTGAKAVSAELYSTLVGIQKGLVEDKKGWIVEID